MKEIKDFHNHIVLNLEYIENNHMKMLVADHTKCCVFNSFVPLDTKIELLEMQLYADIKPRDFKLAIIEGENHYNISVSYDYVGAAKRLLLEDK